MIQIGGPKGVARLLQRAVRCGINRVPLAECFRVPTQAMELVEYVAAREAMEARKIEKENQFVLRLIFLPNTWITLALGGGFNEKEYLQEIRTAWSYRDLSDQEWRWGR